jgi:hypothetical protein
VTTIEIGLMGETRRYCGRTAVCRRSAQEAEDPAECATVLGCVSD